jgi:hypothetical protein
MALESNESARIQDPQNNARDAFMDELNAARPMPAAAEKPAVLEKESPQLVAADKPAQKEPVYNASPERVKQAQELADRIVKSKKVDDEVVKGLTSATPNREAQMLLLINQALKKHDMRIDMPIEGEGADFGIWAKLMDTKKNTLIDKRKI